MSKNNEAGYPDPESEGQEAAMMGYALERAGDIFLSREGREWLEKRRMYCRTRSRSLYWTRYTGRGKTTRKGIKG